MPPDESIFPIIDLALAEDTGHGDVTSEILIPQALVGKAAILAKAEGVLAGIDIARKILLRVDESLEVTVLIRDGSGITSGDIIATVYGKVASILRAERVMLNFLQRLSGVATQASEYAARTQGLKARIVDTRKTTPGLRMMEKYAVLMGGAQNHRFHLGDAVLIKDTHLAAMRARGMDLKSIVNKARKEAPPGICVEVEVATVEEALEAAETGADIIMLDNMSPEEMRRAVNQLPANIRTEASGGVNLDNVREVAETGVDIISIGAITHSVKALDISLKIDPDSIRLP
ncbi:MAG TPA: carboxylating nicotinate-nucleotide diphosphorylase [Dehalococcoidia bacterium]|nr:carboxylating nicotinate-nucleotide diphosphorylase [Dehalococcoidia bacterium]